MVFAEWRMQAFFVGVGALCLAMAVFVLFGVLEGRSRRLERHNAELADLAAALSKSETRFRNFA